MGHAVVAERVKNGDVRCRRPLIVHPTGKIYSARQRFDPVGRCSLREIDAGVCGEGLSAGYQFRTGDRRREKHRTRSRQLPRFRLPLHFGASGDRCPVSPVTGTNDGSTSQVASLARSRLAGVTIRDAALPALLLSSSTTIATVDSPDLVTAA